MRVTWLPQVLRDAGLKVAVVDGADERGREFAATPKGVVNHHTAGPATGEAPSLGIVTNGRSDLPGPLSQLVLGRSGTFYYLASGRANHAGVGDWQGVTTGNASFLGIEAEATGRDPWPDVQMDAYRRGVAAILRKLGRNANWCCGHKEFALPRGRKPDPNFDMVKFRAGVQRLLDAPPPAPPEDDDMTPADRALLDRLHAARNGLGKLNAPIVGHAYRPQGGGWWVAADGGVWPWGGAPGYGSLGGDPKENAPCAGIAAGPDGYWLYGQDGGVFPFGPDAGPLPAPIPALLGP